jgi:hypothetical protein
MGEVAASPMPVTALFWDHIDARRRLSAFQSHRFLLMIMSLSRVFRVPTECALWCPNLWQASNSHRFLPIHEGTTRVVDVPRNWRLRRNLESGAIAEGNVPPSAALGKTRAACGISPEEEGIPSQLPRSAFREHCGVSVPRASDGNETRMTRPRSLWYGEPL